MILIRGAWCRGSSQLPLSWCQLKKCDLRGHAQPERNNPISCPGVHVELASVLLVQAHVIREKHPGKRPAQRTDSELSTMGVSDDREWDPVLPCLGECRGLMREKDGCGITRLSLQCARHDGTEICSATLSRRVIRHAGQPQFSVPE